MWCLQLVLQFDIPWMPLFSWISIFIEWTDIIHSWGSKLVALIFKVSGATARWPLTDSAVPSSLLLRSAGLQPADLLLILLFLPYYYSYSYYYYYYQSIGAIIIIIKHLVCEIRYCPYKNFRHVCNYIKVML